ncbi:hypothetical protein [Streptomyces sp. SID14515]|uniref:hypothetical protein n=1 Tax=Streptomyces sp. SID14515 TaxID=2706074 RepID=UPI0013CBE3FE|nr:hypothetical protein [Streptomyces sp. SID14515]NEB42326.1 hypothetical protein [Streptomyces sp. SID14515]
MTDLDTVFAAGQALAAVHTAVDQVIDAALFYGPGTLLTAAVVVAWRAGRWTVTQVDQWLQDRADRREYTARAHRLCRVADNADAVTALPEIDLITYLDNKLAATTDLAPEEGR